MAARTTGTTRKTIAYMHQIGPSTPVSPVTVNTHTIEVRAHGDCAKICILIAMQHNRSFVRSFVIAGRGPAYSGPQR